MQFIINKYQKNITSIKNFSSSVSFLSWLCAFLVILFYNYLYSFSFLPLTEGWFTVYGKLINDGLVPYKDFYLYLTPLYPLIISEFINIFGDTFFALRVFGLLITLLILTFFYLILLNIFKPIQAMCVSIVCMVYYQSGVAYISYDFTQILTLFTLISIFSLIQLSDLRDDVFKKYKFKIIFYLILAGLFASLAFFIKQSNGVMILISSYLATFFILKYNFKKNILVFIYFLLGSILPFLLILIWTIHENFFTYFTNQIFTDAISSKGNLDYILFGWIKGFFTNTFIIQMKTISIWFIKILLASIIIYYISKKIRIRKKRVYEYILIFTLLIIFTFSIINAYFDLLYFNNEINTYALHYNNYLIPIVISVIIIQIIFFIICLAFTKLEKYINPKHAIVLIFSVGMIFGNGTSAGLSEIGIFLFLGYILTYLMSANLFKVVGSLVVVLFGFSLVFSLSSKKFQTPYTWWGIQEPDVRSERSISNIELIKDIRLSKISERRFQVINNLLKKYDSDSSIFAFPNIPIMYLLANTTPKSKVVISWFDFLPDNRAKEEAKRIHKSPPDVIINLVLPEIAWSVHEKLFRNNNRLGQRDIIDVIDNLTLNKSIYNLELRDKLPNNLVLEIWTKK